MLEQTSWWLYVVCADRRMLYTGVTTDVERRYAEHLAGGARAAKALRGAQHIELVFRYELGNKSLAHRVERLFKQLSRAKRLAVVEGRLALDQVVPLTPA